MFIHIYIYLCIHIYIYMDDIFPKVLQPYAMNPTPKEHALTSRPYRKGLGVSILISEDCLHLEHVAGFVCVCVMCEGQTLQESPDLDTTGRDAEATPTSTGCHRADPKSGGTPSR